MIDREKLFKGLHVAPFTGGMSQGQVDGINTILDCWESTYRILDPRFIAYSLATVYWECDKTMQPIAEYGHGAGHSYGLPTGPWHMAYYGRGDVQLTFEANYAHATKRLRELGVIDNSIDLEKNPELALRPDIAAKILVVGMVEGWFTNKKLSDYFNDTVDDPVGSRRIINGTDNANTIAHIYGQFLTAIKGAWIVVQTPTTTSQTVAYNTAVAGASVSTTPPIILPSKPLPASPLPYSEGPLAAIIRLLTTLLTTLFPRKV